MLTTSICSWFICVDRFPFYQSLFFRQLARFSSNSEISLHLFSELLVFDDREATAAQMQ